MAKSLEDSPYEKKHEKYSKTLDQLKWLKACSSDLHVAYGIWSVATLRTFISLPVGVPLGAVSLAGVTVSGVATALTKKYQKKLAKLTKLTDILTLVLAVFETRISKTFNNRKIDEREFNMLQTLHSEALNDLSNIGSKMAAETISQLKKVCWKESMT